jgi:hypothetical protein
MLDFEAQWALPDIDLALLLTYCASLAHVEQELLDQLVGGEGASDIVLVLDEHQHEETFFETAALLRVGLDYQVHPARMPVPGPAFHPKLYVLAGRRRIRVLVASANLTLFGCRANAEVCAVLELALAETEDALAFRDLADFLDRLPDRVEMGDGAQAAGRLAERIRHLLPDPLPIVGRRLVHSLDRAILPQLTELVDPADVTRVDVISPFFDRTGHALGEIQSAFPMAEVRVLTGPDAAGTLDGAAVAAFPDPPALETIQRVGGKPRPLHAKVLRLHTDDGVWSLSGSPNATTPGLLKSVAEGGNLEVAVVAPEDLASGLEPVESEPARWETLAYQDRGAPGDAPAPRGPGVSVLSASLDGEYLSVQVAGASWAPDVTGWAVSCLLPGGEASVPVQARSESGRIGQDRTGSSRTILEGRLTGIEVPEYPVVLRVSAETPDGLREGRAWLAQVALLRRTGWERRSHRIAARIEGGGSLSDTESQAFGDMLLQIVAEICAPAAGPTTDPGPGGDDGKRPEMPDSAQTINVSELISAEPGAANGHLAVSLRRKDALDRILRAFRSSFLPLDEEDEPDEDPTNLERVGRERRREPDSLKATTVRHLRDVFARSILAWTRAPVDPTRVGEMVRLIETVIWALFRYELRLLRSGADQHARTLNDVLVEALRAALSIDGFHSGKPAGWLVRAWADPRTRDEVEAFLSAPGVREGYLAHLGAAMARAEAAGTSRGEETWKLARAGLNLVTGTHAVDGEQLDRVAGTLISGDEQLPKEEILIAVQVSADEPNLLQAARWWLPLILDGSGTLPDDAPPALVRLMAQAHAGRARPFAPFRTDGTACGSCHVAVPVAAIQHLTDPGQVTTCQTCGAVLVPFDLEHGVCHDILNRLLPRADSP